MNNPKPRYRIKVLPIDEGLRFKGYIYIIAGKGKCLVCSETPINNSAANSESEKFEELRNHLNG